MSHISFPSIASFSNVRKAVLNYPQLLNNSSKITFRSKIKLHGSNVGIQIINNRIQCQTRESLIMPDSDYKGFATWANSEAVKIPLLEANKNSRVILYGELIGKGIQDNVAASQIPNRSFCIFAAVPLDQENNPSDTFIVDPSALKNLVLNVPNTYVIPWHGEAFTIDLLAQDEILNPILEKINADVLTVEQEDPFIRETFGILGVGEGLVYVPLGSHAGRENYSNLSFKAKGNQHNTVKETKPAQIDSTKAKSVEDFSSLVCSESRLEQASRAVSGGDFVCSHKLIGPFLAWITSDVKKECQDILEASNLKWDDVKSRVQLVARAWYLNHIKK